MANNSELPSQASVVVIGGGVMGCSTLYHLAKAGVGDAILLERNELTSGTTWHSAAQVRALRSSKNLTDLIKYSISLYASLEQETGQATGWINQGSLSIATNSDRLNFIRRQEALARLYGVSATSISVGQAQERWPLMNTADVIGAVWSPDDGRVGPSDLCAALVKGARRAGLRTQRGHRRKNQQQSHRRRRNRWRRYTLRCNRTLHRTLEPGKRRIGRRRIAALALRAFLFAHQSGKRYRGQFTDAIRPR